MAKAYRMAFLCALFIFFPRLALAGSINSDYVSFTSTVTVQDEGFESYSGTQVNGTAFTGFTATLSAGGEMNVYDAAGTGAMSLCLTASSDGTSFTEGRFDLDAVSATFSLHPQYLSSTAEVCGELEDGSGNDCVSVSAAYNDQFVGITFTGPVTSINLNVGAWATLCFSSIYTEVDGDSDGYSLTGEDCDDGRASAYPGATELSDGFDNDCDGVIDEGTSVYDDDGDGYTEDAGDCDDSNATIYPGNTEYYDGHDQDCDGIVDEETDYYDDDGDGYTEDAGDCDDGDASLSPGVAEISYDGIDQDCDGLADDDDLDSDGFTFAADCDDTNASVYPGAPETCDGLDQDCDGIIDEGTSCYDDDRDGYTEDDGDCDDANSGMNPGAADIAYDGIDQDCSGGDLDDVDGDGSAYPTDCNDANSAIYPFAIELCNSLDDNCDGDVDEGLDSSCYEADGDRDGYTPDEGDCNDAHDGINPGAVDVANNGIDEDCSGADLSDEDGDGFGVADGDCNDGDTTIHPNASEECNGEDEDCDGIVDETTNCYDDDGDGYTEDAGDCDDGNATRHPGASDVPENGIDEDCDGEDAKLPDTGDDTGDTAIDTGSEDTADPLLDERKGGYWGGSYCEGCNSGTSPLDNLGWLAAVVVFAFRRRSK